MAASIRCLFRLNTIIPSNSFLRNTCLNVGARFLYTENSLGLNGYESTRITFRNQFMNVENAFRQKMDEVCKEDGSMIFTEDLKAMLHLIQKKEQDLDLIVKMIEKYSMQNKELRFATFVFGPIIMRAFYYLDEPDVAFNTFLNPNLTDLFAQLTSIQILMCLLYKHQKYDEIRSIYDVYKTRYSNTITQPRNITVLVFAACCKQNTTEALEYSLQIWSDLTQRGFRFLRRAILFISYLAYKQNRPDIALEIISDVREPRYIDARCLKLLIYAKLGRFDDILPIIKQTLEAAPGLNSKKEFYFQDVINQLEQELTVHTEDTHSELQRLLTLLKHNNHVSTNDTLESHIMSSIDVSRRRRNRNLPLRSEEMMNHRNISKSGLRHLM